VKRSTLNNIMKIILSFVIWFAISTTAHGVACSPGKAPDQGTDICNPATSVPSPGHWLPRCTEGYRLIQGSNICSPDTEVGNPGIWLPSCPHGYRLMQGTEQCIDMPNHPPVANAGPDQVIHLNDTVTLDGSKSSDGDHDSLSYQWNFVSKPSGSNASLSRVTDMKPTFVADVVGRYQLRLIVNDGTVSSAADWVTVTAIKNNTGTLDPSFGGDGRVTSGGENDSGNDITLDSANNVYVTGYSNDDMIIWKYKSDGTLDNTFGGDGIVTHDNAAGGKGFDTANTIALDSAGNIYVAGYSTNAKGNRNMIIWKYRSDGTLDTTFGGDGIVGYFYPDFESYAKGMALDSAGNIYLTGYFKNSEGAGMMMVWKYKSDGTLDSTFSNDGVTVDYDCIGNSIVLDNTGNIYVTGSDNYPQSSSSNMIIWKYKSDGTLDNTFDDDGIVVYEGPAVSDVGNDIVMDSVGNIYVAGTSNFQNDFITNAMALWKYKSNGALDTTFGRDGVVTSRIDYGSWGYSIALNRADDIYVAGYYYDDIVFSVTIWKYRNDGTRDVTFSEDGILIDEYAAYGYSSVLDSVDNIYMTGRQYGGTMLTVKYK